VSGAAAESASALPDLAEAAAPIGGTHLRKSTIFLWVLAGQAALAGAFAGHAVWARGAAEEPRERTRAVVRSYRLTDLNLFNEARYTRHLSQADLHTAFQDHPSSLEHFPSGSLVRPRPPGGSEGR
jgi:hypothetical protein